MLSVPGLAILSVLSSASVLFDKPVQEFSHAVYHGNILTKKKY
jgi:hypothetical protein